MDRWFLLRGAALVLLGIMGPALLPISLFGIYPGLYQAVDQYDQGLLVLMATKVVLINTLRVLPHYLGTFIISDGLYRVTTGRLRYGALLAPLVILPVVYHSIFLFHGVAYDLGTPAVMIVAVMVLLGALRDQVTGLWERTAIIAVVLFGVQWLDVMPTVERLGCGRGDVSREVKLIASFLGASDVLDFIGWTFVLFALTVATLGVRLLIAHHRELERERLVYERDRELERVRVEALEAKALREMRSLVHDLKTPLTTIQGLTSVLQLIESAADPGGRPEGVCQRIMQATDTMNHMISDMLYPKRRQPLGLAELIRYATAQVSPRQGSCQLQVEIEPGIPAVAGNRIRLARALANLIDNSIQAMAPRGGGEIRISARSAGPGKVRITIADDGPGIPAEDRSRVFQPGYTTKGSAGLGLSFVEDVVLDHGGSLALTSQLGVGTTVTVDLPEGEEHEIKNPGH